MSYVNLLRQRRVLVLWLAETLSTFGDRFFTLALAWTAWQRSGAVAMGLVVVVESVPHLLIGALGRKLVARFASFRALAVVEAVQIAVVGAMPWLWRDFGLTAVLGVIVVIGACDAVTGPSLSALVPGLVPPARVRQVTGLMDVTGRLTWVLGPGTAAVLLTSIAPQDLFLLDAATFVVSALAFTWLARRSAPSPAAPEQNTTAEASLPEVAPMARVVLRSHPLIGTALALSGIGEFFQTVVTIGLPIWLTERLHAGASAYALVLSAMGVGSVVGNLLAGNARWPVRFPVDVCVGWTIRGLLLGVMAASASVDQVALLAATGAALVPVTAIGISTQIGRLPGPERLRMFSIYSVQLHVASMGSMLLLPMLLEQAPRAAFAAAGAATAAAGLIAWVVATAAGRRRPVPVPPQDEAELART